jgi:uncharacterized membrane protein
MQGKGAGEGSEQRRPGGAILVALLGAILPVGGGATGMPDHLTRDEERRRRPAGNSPAYVQACLRRGLRFRAIALLISCLATVFFAVAWWWGLGHGSLAAIVPLKAGLACVAQAAATVLLALDLRAAKRDSRRESP